MLTAQEIEQAISRLPLEELARLRTWFDEFEARVWDQQFEVDAQSGKLDKIAEQAIGEYRTGKAKEL